MADTSPMILLYQPREFGSRPVPMPVPPWEADRARPLVLPPVPPAPTASDLQRENLARIVEAVLQSETPISRAGLERPTGLHRDYISQMLPMLEAQGRIRRQRQGRLSFWVAP